MARIKCGTCRTSLRDPRTGRVANAPVGVIDNIALDNDWKPTAPRVGAPYICPDCQEGEAR